MPVTTVLTLLFELAAVEPPLILRVEPSLFADAVPVLPANVIGLTTSVFKAAIAAPTFVTVVVVASVFVIV